MHTYIRKKTPKLPQNVSNYFNSMLSGVEVEHWQSCLKKKAKLPEMMGSTQGCSPPKNPWGFFFYQTTNQCFFFSQTWRPHGDLEGGKHAKSIRRMPIGKPGGGFNLVDMWECGFFGSNIVWYNFGILYICVLANIHSIIIYAHIHIYMCKYVHIHGVKYE